MSTTKQLEDAMRELSPIIDRIVEFEKKYGKLLREYNSSDRELTEEERNEAAIEILGKYSNI